MPKPAPLIALCLLLVTMALLCVGPMWDETATVDETTFIGGGYGYFKTGSTRMAEENPLLSQMILAAPLLAFDVKMPDVGRALMEGRAHWLLAFPWKGAPVRLPELYGSAVDWRRYSVAQAPYLGPVAVTDTLTPEEQNVFWYKNGLGEAQEFGRLLVYDKRNPAERLMFWSRFTQLLLTLATGVLLFYWTRELTQNPWAGVLATALWVFNPVALAYGHLALTEPGIALTFPLAVWWFTKTAGSPTNRNLILLGVFTALAIQMKFLGLILVPTFIALLALQWLRTRTLPTPRAAFKWVTLFAVGAWGTVLLIHFPHWGAPPPIDPLFAERLNVPGWIQAFCPLLIPGEFFKAVALKLIHAKAGQDAFLLGEWSKMGWWYYYPVAMWFKTPLPLLALILIAANLLLRQVRNETLPMLAPWGAAAVYLLIALTSTIDIGVRHVLPIYPLLAVGIADQFARMGRRWMWSATGLAVWLASIAVLAYPFFIPYCNEFAGGTANGYRVLIDSNYDWGQDGKRLKQWMASNHVESVYLDYFGTQPAIEWLQIPNHRVTAETAHQIRTGYLVVSASQLMRPDWGWLRSEHQPVARIGYSLFVYKFS